MAEDNNATFKQPAVAAPPTGMLEVRHLKKEYKSKNGVVTKALDDVSLTFPETGMVFILGKSGSGKSTLLNVCGGLDRMDSGEIVIKGKSSNDFSGQDFDSYRNTFVGFVFQEYNILDEFTVEQNIALALELQNKKRDKEAIARILADVDMTDFAQRKPNTLSGGQKQRVAIARALVKEPEIIMADEPTGALDSKTGQQVFDTLKKLSEKKLVIVISHDRDFAEQYGDRIIELKDGKIISDQTRAVEGEGAKNVRFYGADTVCVSNGANLTDADLASIKTFLAKSGGSAVISTSREKITQFKEDRPEISVGSFENIKEQPKSKAYESPRLIRSHLPARHAVKMGASGLKTKPVRLVFTVLLSVIAFVLFGLASTLMLFDERDVRIQTFQDAQVNFITLGKQYKITESYGDGDSYSYFYDTRMTDAEYKKLNEKYDGAIPAVKYDIQIENISLGENASQFYTQYVKNVIPASDKLQLLAGRMPTAVDEIAVTDFLYDTFKSTGTKFVYGENNTTLTINSYNDILYSAAKPITLRNDGDQYKIVGVFKGMTLSADFKSLKTAADKNERLESMGFSSYMWEQERQSGMYASVAVVPEVFAELKNASGNGDGNIDIYKYFQYSTNSLVLEDGYQNSYYTFNLFSKYEGRTLPLYGMDGARVTSIADGEFAMRYNAVAESYLYRFNMFRESLDDSEYKEMLNSERDRLYNEYSVKQPERNDFIDRDRYNADTERWEQDKDAYIAEHPDVDEYQYEFVLNNPRPNEYDYIDDEKYDAAQQKWIDDRNAFVDKEMLKIRKDAAYVKLIDERKAAAEAKYIAEYPEPQDQGSPEYQEWSYGLSQAISESDPINMLDYMRYNNYSMATVSEVISTVVNLFDELGIDIDFYMSDNTTMKREVKLIGYFDCNYSEAIYLGGDLYDTFCRIDNSYNGSTNTKYEEPADAYIDYVYIPYDGSTARIEQLLDLHAKLEKDDSAMHIRNSANEQLDTVVDIASDLEFGFIIAGAVLALFAFLLMFNFISASITAKKKDIGILRAIGARTTDVFKIFISEALIIAAICFVISAAGSLGICVLLNSIIRNDVGLSVSLFVFGPLSWLCVLGVALITALISTIIPVAIYSRKPPIASIRAL